MPCFIVREWDVKKLGYVKILGKVNEQAHVSQAIASPVSRNMTAGYIKLDPGYDREIISPMDEVDLFLEGSLTYTGEGTTFTARKGNLFFQGNQGCLCHPRRLPGFLCNLSAVSGNHRRAGQTVIEKIALPYVASDTGKDYPFKACH